MGDGALTRERELYERFGLSPDPSVVPEIRRLIAEETAREGRGEGNTLVLRLHALQLFNCGVLADVLLIWRAKRASFDASCAIEVELLCGRGLDATRQYLRSLQGLEAAQVLAVLISLDSALQGFDPAAYSRECASYYTEGEWD
jgi:hypothetical protein